MTELQFRNVLVYVLLWVLVALAGPLGTTIGTGAVPGFGDGEPLAPARGEVAGALALLMTAGGMYLAANRPRVGSEQIAADVDAARKSGVSRRALTVQTKGAVRPGVLTASQVQQVADELESRMKQESASQRT